MTSIEELRRPSWPSLFIPSALVNDFAGNRRQTAFVFHVVIGRCGYDQINF